MDRGPTKRTAIASINHAWEVLHRGKGTVRTVGIHGRGLDPDIYSLMPKRSRYSFGVISFAGRMLYGVLVHRENR